jgi:Zn-dependent protease with chaperone function
MDFFERQDKARRSTKLLVFYFIAAVVLIVVTVYLASVFVFAGAGSRHHYSQNQFALWNPELFLWVAVGTVAVIACGSLYQISQLSSGGSSVATMLGGRPLNPNSSDPDERKLLNVVEEMALASGVPVPEVYLLENEAGINAFAAGFTTSDAVIGVTRGAIKQLNRDELQGVIGHEFSHILNGDMRLNLRLMGVIFGIICLATVGRILLNTRGRKNPLPIFGLALIVIGGVGVFFGRLIQAAASRQREFLADASSVQFTRNPAGLSGALQKIGGSPVGSRLESEHASDACHMFFGNGMRESFISAFATHPPLEERIHAIDPQWDGKFPKPTAADLEDLLGAPIKPGAAHFPPIMGFPFPQAAALAPQAVRQQTVMPSLGKPTPMHLHYAQELRASFPESVQSAAREPLSAAALIYATLLSATESTRATQLKELAQQTTKTIYEKTVALQPDVASVSSRARLPLVELAIPGLRRLSADEFQQFESTLNWLIKSDGQVELFEFVLEKIISRHLEPQFGQTRRAVVQYYSIKPLLPECAVLLSALAHVGSNDAAQIEKAFQEGAPYLRAVDYGVGLLPRSECGLEQVDPALDRLGLAVPQIKKNLIEACVHVVGADGVIQENEAELLRAIADTLDCPMPPFVSVD